MVQTGRAGASFSDGPEPPLNSVERALVEMHVGLTHLMGGDSNDAQVSGFCTVADADSIVSRWRAGAQDAHVMGEARIVWTCLWHVGLWSELVRVELSESIGASFLASRLEVAPPGRDLLRDIWHSIDSTSGEPNFELDAVWNCAGSHLERIRFADDISNDLIQALCALEQRALAGARRQPYLEESFSRSTSVINAFMAAPTSWGGPGPNDVPPWLRDYAIARGGRHRQERAGVIPCWFLVAESTEELRAISAWRSGSQELAVVKKSDSTDVVFFWIELDFDDGQNPGVVEFIYDTRFVVASTALDMVAWVGLVRLEVYEINDGQLKFAFAHGVPLPDMRDRLLDSNLRAFPGFNWLANLETSAEDVLYRMRNSERVQFEIVRRGEAARADESSRAAVAYRAYLDKVDEGARSEYGGVPADTVGIDLAHRALLTELSMLANPVDEIALSDLGSDRGYAQVQFIQDEPARVVCAVASQKPDGRKDAHLLNLAIQDYEAGGLQTDEDGLAELGGLGLRNIVLSPSGPLYAQPLHEEFLNDGFDQVSYAHRSAILGARPVSGRSDQTILLAGWAGEQGEGNHLNYLDIELSALEVLYEDTRHQRFDLGSLPSVVHLAGHGEAGVSATAHWLKATESELLTPSRVLLDADASNTELVYLSACSSGRGVFGVRNVMHAVPLDVAFLERGAACVLSTSAPVNDVVSAAFAIVFHSVWRAGASKWDAYVAARSLVSTGAGSPEARDALDENWPTWASNLALANAAHPDDWMLFRLSGRHW